MACTYDAEEWGGGDYNLTVIIQSKQWIYNIYNLFIIYNHFIYNWYHFIIDGYNYLYIYFNYIYKHIHSNQVIIAITVYEKGKRRMPQESKSLKTLSALTGMSWCMFIRARLLNRVSFVVLRRFVFNPRKQLEDLSAVAVETGIVRSTEKIV